MKKLSSVLAMIFLLSPLTLLLSSAQDADSDKLSGELERITTELYPGVTQTYYSLSASSAYGLQKFWTVEFDPLQPDLYFDVTCGGSYATTLKKVTDTVDTFNASNADKTPIAAINGDLWMVTYAHARVEGSGTVYKDCSDPVVTRSLTLPRGFNMYDGEIITSTHMQLETPYEGKFYSFGITDDGIAVLGNPQVAISIKNTTRNKTTAADGLNRLPANNALVMYSDRGSASNYALADAKEIVIDCSEDYTVCHDAVIKGKIVAVTEPGQAKQAMTANRIILTARGTKISRLDEYSIGDEIEIGIKVTDAMGHSEVWQQMRNAVGGHIPVIVDGKSYGSTDSTKYPMSVLGIKKDGKVVMLTNDGRQSGYSVGIMISQLDNLCQQLDIVTAFILDGGGSAEMVNLINGEYKLVNRPSDGTERAVVNSVILSYGSPRENAQSPTTLTFDSEESLSLLSKPNNLDYTIENEALKLTLNEIRNPNIRINYSGSLNAGTYKYITLTLKPITTLTENYLVTLNCMSGGNLDSPTSAPTVGIRYEPDGGWQTMLFDLSEKDAWTGKINSFKLNLFDYTGIGTIGEGAYVKELSFFATKEEAQAHIEQMNAQMKKAEANKTEEPTGSASSDETAANTGEPENGCKSSLCGAIVFPLSLITAASAVIVPPSKKRKKRRA